MNEKNNKNIEQFDEQDKKLYEAFVELGWINPQTKETENNADPEDSECFPFPPELEDSAIILERINKKNTGKTEVARDKSEGSKLDNFEKESKISNQRNLLLDLTPNLLSLIRYDTKFTASNIAQKLEVTVPFLRGCSDHSESVPAKCKEELINRACNAFPSLDRMKVQQVVEKPGLVAAAGFRDTGFSGKRMTFQEIVEKSGLNEPARNFWLALAEEE